MLENDLSTKDVEFELAETQKTHSRAISLIERYHIDTNSIDLWFERPDQFIGWLTALEGTVTSGTFRKYRSALTEYAQACDLRLLGGRIDNVKRLRRRSIKKSLEPGQEQARQAKEFLKDNRHKRQRRNEIRSIKSQCADHVIPNDITVVGRRLLSSNKGNQKDRYKQGGETLAFIRAGILTGLRPIEWLQAKYHTSLSCEYDDTTYNHVLEVVNAKRKKQDDSDAELEDRLIKSQLRCRQQQLFLEKRFLIINEMAEKDLEFLVYFLSIVNEHKEQYQKWYERCRKTLANIVPTVQFGDSKNTPLFGLSSTRHLFASEVRRSGDYEKTELAAMLGHGTTENQVYYGDISNHTERLFEHPLPKPWPGSEGIVEKNDKQKAKSRNILQLR